MSSTGRENHSREDTRNSQRHRSHSPVLACLKQGGAKGHLPSRFASPEAVRAFYRIDASGYETELELEEFKTNPREDIWSFSVMLYSALTSYPHFFSSVAEEVPLDSEEMDELLSWNGLTDTIADRFKTRRRQILQRAGLKVDLGEEDDMMCWARELGWDGGRIGWRAGGGGDVGGWGWVAMLLVVIEGGEFSPTTRISSTTPMRNQSSRPPRVVHKARPRRSARIDGTRARAQIFSRTHWQVGRRFQTLLLHEPCPGLGWSSNEGMSRGKRDIKSLLDL